MEDYKEKYKDVLKREKEEVVRATQLWECGDITREQLEYIFPELQESEDEKVRKQLLDFVHRNALASYSDRDKWVAWLEKQRKPKWTNEDELTKDDILYVMTQLRDTSFYKEDDTVRCQKCIIWLKSVKERLQ